MGLGGLFKIAKPFLPGLKEVGLGLELIGAAKNVFGPKPPGPGRQSYEQLMGAFKAADEAGLHRLSVAGSPAGYSPAPSTAADGLLQAGQALQNTASQKKQDQLIDAQIAESRSRTILNEANSRRALAGPQPGLGSSLGQVQAFDLAANGGARTVSVEPERDLPATQTVTLGNKTSRGLNPEAFEVGLSELIAGLLIHGPQWANSALKEAQLGLIGRSSHAGSKRPPTHGTSPQFRKGTYR